MVRDLLGEGAWITLPTFSGMQLFDFLPLGHQLLYYDKEMSDHIILQCIDKVNMQN